MQRAAIFLLVMLLVAKLSYAGEADNEIKETDKYESRIITLLNEPEIGGIAKFSIRAESLYKDVEMKVTCEIPESWEFINDQNYETKAGSLVNQFGPKGIEVCFGKGIWKEKPAY